MMDNKTRSYVIECDHVTGDVWSPAYMFVDESVANPVVRCRDCNYRRKSWNGKRPDFVPDGFFCAYWGGHELWKPDGFCAWGIAKTGNQNP